MKTNRKIADELVDHLLNDCGVGQLSCEDDIETITELIERVLFLRVDECARICEGLDKESINDGTVQGAARLIRNLNGPDKVSTGRERVSS